jgi:hypothetical protein
MFTPSASTVCIGWRVVCWVSGAVLAIWHTDVAKIGAMPEYPAVHSDFLPAICADWGGGWLKGARMWVLGGQARMAACRQITAEPRAPASTTKVNAHATSKAVDGGTGGGTADSRSIALIAGTASNGSAGSRNSSGSAAAMYTHSPPQRVQRIFLPGFRRDAGTSYVAAQVGQAIRMKTHCERARTILRRSGDGAKDFR